MTFPELWSSCDDTPWIFILTNLVPKLNTYICQIATSVKFVVNKPIKREKSMIVLRERERDLGERRSKLANSGPARAGVRGFFFVQGPNPSSSLCLSLSILFSIYLLQVAYA